MKCKFVFLLLSMFLLILFTGAVALGAELERDVQSHFRQTKEIAQRAVSKLNGGISVSTELIQLNELADSLQVDHLLLQERFASRSNQIAEFSGQIQQRQQAMEQVYRQVVSDLLATITSLSSVVKPTEADFQTLISLVDKFLPVQRNPILGSLPYQKLDLPARQPVVSPVVIPAYQGGNSAVALADTQSSASAQITPEIAALAESLDWNPVKIYAWVLNNIETQWYWGSMKGAAETLRQKSGNDADQAALLVALMRAANFPARYVRGVIEFAPGIERLQQLVGLDDPLTAVRYLQQAGIPAEPVIAAGRVTNVRVEHVWVEVYVPYANYRGAVLDEQGRVWLPLDTHFKPEGYLASPPATAIPPQEMIAGLRDEYLSRSQSSTPVEYLRQRVEVEVAAPWDETLSDFQLQKTAVEVLPASLQFKTLAVTGESTELPTELVQTVTFRGGADDGRELFSLTLPVREASNKQVVLSYEPESLDDQLLIDAHGGLSNTPAYLVRLRPVLLIDGERKIVAQDGLAMGDDYQLTVQFKGPSGSAAQTARHIVGNPVVLGIVAQQALPTPVLPEDEQDAVWMLWETAQDYISRWNAAEDQLAAFFHLRMCHPLPTLVTVGGVLDVSRLLDMPQELTWKGLFIDAGLRRIELAAQSGEQQRVVEFMRLSALQGSVLEQRIFEDKFQVASACTARVLATANESGQPVLTLDSSNVAELLPTLVLPEHIRSDIEAAVHQGLRVTLPADETTLLQWSGFGYLKENPLTGEAGYMLSGMIAGGTTIEEFPNGYQTDVLQAPFTDPPNRDVLAAVHIAKFLISDRQTGVVGQQLEKPLGVLVTDIKGRPVVGAEVTFKHIAGLGENDPPVTTLVSTDAQGIARFQPVLGKSTDDNPSFQKVNQSDTHVTQVGVNLFDAAVQSRYGELSITQPFEVYGRPDTAHHLKEFLGDGNRSTVNNPAGSLLLKVFDQYENPVSNVPVTFDAQAAEPASGNASLAAGYRNIEFYRPDECTFDYPLWDDCKAVSHSTLTIDSSYHGAMVDTLLGNTLATHYTVKASAPGVEAVFFNLYTGGWNTPGEYYPPSLNVKHMSTVNESGQRIDAVKVGNAFNRPLRAALVLTYSDYSLSEKKTCTTGTGSSKTTYDCWDLLASGLIQTRMITNGKVTFDPKTGGQVTATEIDAEGLYLTNYTAGDVPALNLVDIFGEAQVKIPVVYGTVSSDTYFTVKGTKLTSATIAERTVTLKSGQIGLFDSDSKNLIPVESQQKETFSIYGVDVPTQVNPEIVMLGDGGIARQNVTTDYTILPQGSGTAGYTAYDTYLDLFSGDCAAGVSDKWIGYLFGSAKQGAGDAVYSRGSVFDPKQQYCVQMVLNRGSSAEIRGDKVKLQTLYADLDIDSDNNAGWQADGTHNLPSRNPLEDQAEDLAGLPGKVIKPNLLDVDGDKVPGFADGINVDGQAGDGVSVPFYPLSLEIDTLLDKSKIKLKFNYSASDPAQVKRTGNETDGYTYQAGPGHLRIWTKDGGESRIVTSVKNGGDYISPDETYTLNDLGLSNGGVLNLYVEGIDNSATPGDQQIKLTIDPDGTAVTTLIGDLVNSTVLSAALVPDFNHDRVIDDQDRQRAALGDTYYFWINDDDDSGETGGDDIPGETGLFGSLDYESPMVDGVRDLIDFFPVAFELNDLVKAFPQPQFKYRLRAADQQVNLMFPVLNVSTAGKYLTNVDTARGLAEKVSKRVGKDGNFLTSFDQALTKTFQQRLDEVVGQSASNTDQPVLLFEGNKKSTKPLVLDILNQSDQRVFSAQLNLSLDGVEQMFRHINLIEQVGGPPAAPLPKGGTFGGVPDRIEVPKNYPDSEVESDDNFVFVHGYNINGQQARGFYSEMFKRLYWSGLQAKFWGVSWYGFESQGERPGPGRFTPDYHINVEHAWDTAGHLSPALALYIPPGENITLAAHSLGNAVVAGFLSDYYGNSNDTFWSGVSATVTNVYMIDAAVALEAYSSGLADMSTNGVAEKTNNRNMYHPDWYDFAMNRPTYKKGLWASDWYQLFDDHDLQTVTDKRELLTWRDRYKTMTDLCQDRGSKPGLACYNFYSSGEEVLATHETPGIDFWHDVDDDPNILEGLGGYYSFALQERLKGRMKKTVLWPGVYGDNNSMTAENIYIAGSVCGGWGFNLEDDDYWRYADPDSSRRFPIYGFNASLIPLDQLKTRPFFRLNSLIGNLLGNIPLNTLSEKSRTKLLSDCIPALTLPAGGPGGANLLQSFAVQDMQSLQSDWPIERADKKEWQHSDLEEVAYPFVYKLFDAVKN